MDAKKQPIPGTMIEAVRQFADPQVAHDFFVEIRFPNGVACPRVGCGSARVAYLAKVMRWYCNECKRQFSAKVGTIFEDSPIPLSKWLPVIWLIASNRNGISSYEIARGLGVTQKTAWLMLHRVREAMQTEAFDLFTGTVEVDEAYIGGKQKNMSLSKRRTLRERREARGLTTDSWDEKTPVLGMVERGGRVRACDLRTDAILRGITTIPEDRFALTGVYDVVFSASEAIEFGIAQQVGDFAPPPGAKVFTV
jgi:transposase-like protein